MRTVGLAVAFDIMRERVPLFFRYGLGNGPIAFVDLAVPYHFIEAHKGLARLGQQNHTADRPVDAMDDSEKYFAGFSVASADELLDLVLQSDVPIGIGLHQIAAVFVYRQDVVVFVEYVFLTEHGFRFFCIVFLCKR